jgi:hypothetical protein
MRPTIASERLSIVPSDLSWPMASRAVDKSSTITARNVQNSTADRLFDPIAILVAALPACGSANFVARCRPPAGRTIGSYASSIARGSSLSD